MKIVISPVAYVLSMAIYRIPSHCSFHIRKVKVVPYKFLL